MQREVCAIWGTPTLEARVMGDTYQYDSPRAGGKYVMSGSARAQIKSRSVEVKKKLTSWIVSQHLASFDWPIIDSRVLFELVKR
jgi:hypothetical protein